jgi:hypothetical protein
VSVATDNPRVEDMTHAELVKWLKAFVENNRQLRRLLFVPDGGDLHRAVHCLILERDELRKRLADSIRGGLN